MLERIQKILSRHGIASRRRAEELILAGAVFVNGQVVKLGDKADEESDSIVVRGKKITIAEKNNFVYYLLNKPIGYECSLKGHNKNTQLAVDLVPKNPRVWTVGRLDKDSSGLLVLTNDGQLTNQLTHPKFKHEKEYLVKVNKKIEPTFLMGLKKGVHLTEGLAKADEVRQVTKDSFSIILHQGWKRQIRRMCYALGYNVLTLNRIRIGHWQLGNLKVGEYRIISNL